jgi:hypothetical protein
MYDTCDIFTICVTLVSYLQNYDDHNNACNKNDKYLHGTYLQLLR